MQNIAGQCLCSSVFEEHTVEPQCLMAIGKGKEKAKLGLCPRFLPFASGQKHRMLK